MDKYQETFDTWNKVASLYQEKFMDLDIYNESYDFICNSLVKPNSKILDIGCGPGNITKYLLSKRPDFKIMAIDVAPNMIKLASQNNPGIDCQVMDCRNIGQLQTSFDAVVCGFCLPFLSPGDCEKLISDAASILNTNGLIYLSFVEGDESNSGYKIASTGDRTYFYYHNLEKLQAQLLKNQFSEIQVSHVNFVRSVKEQEMHTIVTASKLTRET